MIEIVEVAPRDGFQSVGPFISTEQKIAIVAGLYAAGLRRMEVTSFVSPAALPQMADAADVLAAASALPGLDAQVLVPTVRHATRALEAGSRHLSFVLSVSEAHNRNNVRRAPTESGQDYAQVVSMCAPDAPMRLNLATAFDCPFVGPVDPANTLELLEQLLAARTNVEVALCDTTGRVAPGKVASLFKACMARYPDVAAWAFHGHDTFGMGAANAYAAYEAGVRIFDAAAAGLGGCPFAPGATGNTATEDLVYMFDGMGVDTGVDLQSLISVAETICTLEGAKVGGRCREAIEATRKRAACA